jgi:hypothetical protein
MQKKYQLGKFAFCVVLALVIPTLFILVMIHHGRNTSRTVSAHSAGLAAPKPVPATTFDWTNYGKLPLAFEANQGQTASDVRFLSHGNGYTLFLTGQEAVLTLRQPVPGSDAPLDHAKLGKMRGNKRAAEKLSVLRMRLDGANPNAAIAGVDRMPTKVNYFIGDDPKKWHTDVPAYAQVKYQSVYPGVDLLFYGNQRRLEYDFVVAPEADVSQIALDVQGANRLRIDRHGNLLMTMHGGEVELQKPLVYQDVNGERHEIAGNYVTANNHEVRFAVADYDHTQPLTIDPTFTLVSTYLGGSGSDAAFGIALDAAGDAYIAGGTTSTDFPQQNAEPAAPPTDIAANGTAFVSELDPTGHTLLYSTYLGGSGSTNGGDRAMAIAVDAATPLNIYVTGFTFSPDFPVSTNALIGQPGPAGTGTGGSGFVTKLTPSLTGTAQLTYSTYLGGDTEDVGNGIAVDANGNAFVAGLTLSTNFPTSTNAISTALLNVNGSAFLTEINTKATTGPTSLVYSTYFGGTNGAGSAFLFGDEAFGIAIDSTVNAYIVGTTTSTDFPTQGTALSPCTSDSNGTAFVYVINTSVATPTVPYSSCLGAKTSNTETQGQAIAFGPNSTVYVTGQTTSADFPVTTNSIPTPPKGVGAGVVFVSLIDTTGATPNKYSTFLGGSNGDFPFGIAFDATGNAYVAGETNSADFPLTQGALIQARNNGNGTGFVAKINPGGNGQADLVYSSYFGGNGVNGTFDSVNGVAVSGTNAFITGQTASSDLPVSATAFQTKLNSAASTNAFVAGLALVPTISASPNPLPFGTQLVGATSAPMFVTLTNNTASAITLTIPATIGGANPTDFAVAAGTCTTPLAAGGSCTVGATFTPAAAQAYSATLQIVYTFNGIAGTSLQVALTGTGSTTVAAITFNPTSLTFPGQLLTTSSSAMPVTLKNTGNLPVMISKVATGTMAFTETDNCAGTTVAPAGTCTIMVTFAPPSGTTPGTVTDAVSVTDNAPGSPQTVGLTGTAWDFSVSGPSGVTLGKGQMGTFPVTITGLGGFTGQVMFSCTPGNSFITSCAVPATAAAPAPGATATGTLTASSFVVAPQSMKLPPAATLRQVFLVMLIISLLFMIPSTRRFRARMGMLGAMMVFIVVAGCNGGGGPKPKTSTVTITPSSGGVTKPAITVNVSIT